MYRATFRSTLQKCGIIVMDFNFQQTNKRELFFGKPWTYSDNILANN